MQWRYRRRHSAWSDILWPSGRCRCWPSQCRASMPSRPHSSQASGPPQRKPPHACFLRPRPTHARPSTQCVTTRTMTRDLPDRVGTLLARRRCPRARLVARGACSARSAQRPLARGGCSKARGCSRRSHRFQRLSCRTRSSCTPRIQHPAVPHANRAFATDHHPPSCRAVVSPGTRGPLTTLH